MKTMDIVNLTDQHLYASAVPAQTSDLIHTVNTHRWLSTICLILATAVLPFLHYLFIRDAPPKGLKRLPGPRSTIPWLGRVHDVDTNAPWFAWTKFTRQYNNLCASTICGDTHIWVGTQAIATEFLCKKAAIYSSRPEIPAVPGSDSQGQYLPLLAYGDQWRNQRKFAHTVLSQAQNSKFYGYIDHEMKNYLHKLLVDPTDHHALTDRFCGRIAARLGYGNPASAAAHCKNAGEFIPQISPSGPITNLVPFLGKLPEWINPSVREVRTRREREERLWKGLLAQARHEMDLGIAPISYAQAYLARKEAETGSRAFTFDDHEAAYAVGMLVTVSIFTIGGPLYCFQLCMVLFPEWQARVRQEVDEVVGDRIVTLADSPKLPILRAVIKECFRWRPPVPLGVPRLLEEDDTWNGYFVPRGTIFHAVDLAMARDPLVYPFADDFRPDRWLKPEFPTYKEPLTEHPRLMGIHSFGMGRRMCPGIELTEAELLVACGSLVGALTFSPVKDDNGVERPPPDWNFTPNVIGGPLPFEMDIKPRSAKHAQRIRRQYDDSVQAETYGRLLSH